jgi:hypothetical protein
MFDLLALLVQPQIFRLVLRMMLDEQAFEPVNIVRQCVDVEHTWIIRVVLLHARVIHQLFDPGSGRRITHSGGQRRRRRISVCSATSVHTPPVDAFEERRKLSRAQLNDTITCVRPDEAAAMQPFIEQAHPIGIMPEQFHAVAAAAAEDEQLAGKRIG